MSNYNIQRWFILGVIDLLSVPIFSLLLNHNVAARVDALHLVNASAWIIFHENKFNQIDRDVERAMKCAANACRRKSYKKAQMD
jgi:hypothetical protein